MISPNGVKVNMCCASCLHNKWLYYTGAPKVTRWCAKKDKAIINGRNKRSYYVMDEFFQKGGYKPNERLNSCIILVISRLLIIYE